MDTRYQPLYRQATAMQSRFHDYTHANAFDPGAMALQKQIHSLTNDLATGRNPRVIDQRLRSIQTQLRRTQIQNPAMAGQSPLLSNGQKSFMHTNFERMRQNVVQHPNF